MARAPNNWEDPKVPQRFAELWNDGATVGEMAAIFGIKEAGVYERASRLRASGVTILRKRGRPVTTATGLRLHLDRLRAKALQRAAKVRGCAVRTLVKSVVDAVTDDTNLLDNVLDDGVKTPLPVDRS